MGLLNCGHPPLLFPLFLYRTGNGNFISMETGRSGIRSKGPNCNFLPHIETLMVGLKAILNVVQNRDLFLKCVCVCV